jgi:rhodanese-related sulfurtransferase
MTVKSISPSELSRLQKERVHLELIDVRTPVEFQELHVAGAVNIPLDRLDPHDFMRDRNGRSEEPLYVICRSGNRATTVGKKLTALGGDIYNVEGGTVACEQAGLPMVRGKKSVSLERQVRIAAGSFVLLGVVLAWLVHPYFVLLSAFVGAGLVFSGVTDTCGMGLLLARMPWNQISTKSSTSQACESSTNGVQCG